MVDSFPVCSALLRPAADEVSRRIHRLGLAAQRTLFRHREEVVERQLDQERLAWTAMELFASACVLSRIDFELTEARLPSDEVDRRVKTAMYFLSASARRIDDELKGLNSNNDAQLRAAGTGL
ncbi:MAG: acyl-CoA dehydrogenase [Planctomycetota bacterium]|nr:MAG: acyl-CoA dehydrogenase [Planctomycetota bacterium]